MTDEVDRYADKIVWSIDSLPKPGMYGPRPPLPDPPADPHDVIRAFLQVDGNAMRFLARHPGTGPAGCRRCVGMAHRCGWCTLATLALQAAGDEQLSLYEDRNRAPSTRGRR